jgi:hypothetical protein
MNLFLVASIIFVLNIPFGYWRANVKKYSIQWILSIHLPIPFIILLRIYSGIGFKFITYPILIGAFFLGQLSGSHLFKRKENTPIEK